MLTRPKLGIPSQLVKSSLSLIKRAAAFVEPKRIASLPVDPDDSKFLDCAAEADADYLVTGSKRHFPKTWGKTRVVSARELLQELIPILKRPGD